MVRLSDILKNVDPEEALAHAEADRLERKETLQRDMLEDAKQRQLEASIIYERDQTQREILERVKALNDNKTISSNAQSNPQPAQLTTIEKLCLKWVNRGFDSAKNLDEFLADYNREGGEYYSRWQFEDALRKCSQKGLITRDGNGRYKQTPK